VTRRSDADPKLRSACTCAKDGSVCPYEPSVFPGGVGNTQQDPERFRSLFGDVSEKIFGRLPDSTWVYPGHGSDTTLGAERPHLAEWHERGW
jgi:hypothetical protein